jgi:NADPH oxidase 5
MASSPRPSGNDARLLSTLERAFAKHAGADGVIDVAELKKALGLRSEYLARRVLAAFDLDGDGVIQKQEFLEGVRKLCLSSDTDKLMFAFRLHDHDGDGTLSRDELFRMIAIGLAENDVTERATQPPDALAKALFNLADTNKDGKISFEEFEAVVRKRPALLEKMTRSEAVWIAPNEDLLVWLDPGAARESAFSRLRENGWTPVVLLLAWAAINVGIFVSAMFRGAHDGANPIMQTGRALGACINFDGALLLVPVMRRLLTWVRSTWIGRRVPIDEAITFHRIVGHTLVVLGIAHGSALLVSYGMGHPTGSVEHLLLLTERGLTGVALLIIILVMWVFALALVRQTARFELFYFTHLLYVAWFGFAIAHSPSFLFWAGVPLFGFGVEQILRLSRRGKKTALVGAQALRSGVTRLELEKPPGFKHRAGDYVFVRIAEIAKHEWHPFTLSSAPENGSLTVHVRTLGNWTTALRERVEHDEKAPGTHPLTVFVDGPYGSPSAHIETSRHAVFIGAGIGVTPFAAVLESLVRRENGEHPSTLEKVHFFWLNKDQYSFEWFGALLKELEKIDEKALLDIHLCMTAGRTGATSLALEVAREILHASGRSDIITGLRTHTHMGHPDWEKMLGAIKAQHAPSKVDVFFCGPLGLANKIRVVCQHLGMPFRREQF